MEVVGEHQVQEALSEFNVMPYSSCNAQPPSKADDFRVSVDQLPDGIVILGSNFDNHLNNLHQVLE